MVEWSGFLDALARMAAPPSASAPAECLYYAAFHQLLPDSLREPKVPQSDDQIARLISTGRDLAEQLRQAGLPLAVALATQARVREELLDLCFNSFTDPEELRRALSAVQRLGDALFSGMVNEWLRLQTISHRRRHREARRYILQEKKRYDKVFRRMREPVFIVDRELRLVEVNPAFERFFGLSGREIFGSTCMTVIGHGFCASCPLPQVIRGGGSFSEVEVAIDVSCPGSRVATGDSRIVRLTGTSLGDEDEGGGAIVLIQDVTEQKRTEGELLRSEEKFRSLVENLPDLIWRADRRGRLLFISANSERILGLSVEALLNSDRFSRIHPEDVAEVRESYALFWASGKVYDIQYRFQRGDGVWIWLHDRASAIGENQGRPFADGLSWEVTDFKNVELELEGYRTWLEELVDERTEALRLINTRLQGEIAERKLAQKELLRMAASLQISNADLEQFAYVASHDLREPLMLVTAFAERLRHHYSGILDARGNSYIERIIKSAGTLSELVEALLQLSRVSTSTRAFELLDLNRLLLEVLEELEEPLVRSGTRVEVGPLPNLHGDPVQMRQLFQNLISNALKYRRPEVLPLVVVAGSVLEEGICEITVTDNGIGMAEKDLDRIFDPFVRLHGREVYEGCGMGLATCRKIVDRHGGEIEAQSQPGQGAVLVLRLPTRHLGGI
ncbi:MAG: PAS domain S-box protein [Desulfobulbaceae bacterium]|nr:PAS domain S-box protein [Desulfobulbaceae bacterium]